MRRHIRLGSAWGLCVLLMASGGEVRAQRCVPVAEFNDEMDQQLSTATDVTLRLTVTGVNLDDYFNAKGWLAEFLDTHCAEGGSAALKVYGTSDPINAAHPPGTVKLEYGSYCCPEGGCPIERWADPNPGEAIFSAPAQVCSIVMVLNPVIVSYDIQCDGGATFHGEGGNPDGITVGRAALLSEVSGGHAMTATIVSEEICYEPSTPVGETQIFPVIEDVTVAPFSPATVYEPVEDLACGLDDGTVYLKFDLRGLIGRVTRATVFLHSAADGSAQGTGGDVMYVSDDGWSESTLVWNARPNPDAAALGRIDAVTPDRWYSVDVSAQVSAPDVYSFALVPRATDLDTAHFLSKEATQTLQPYLSAEVEVVDADGDGSPAGPDCDDARADIHPGAPEICGDGVDDDCSGQADEACGPGGNDAGTDGEEPNDVDAGAANDGGAGDGELSVTGCSCRVGSTTESHDGLVTLLAPAVIAIVRRGSRRPRNRAPTTLSP